MKEGWKVVKLGEVCEFYRGLTYSKKDEVGQSNNIVLRSNNIDLRTFKLNLDDLKYISDDIIIPTEKKVKKGSLLICIANGSKEHLGKIALIDEDIDFAFGGFMGLLTPTSDVMPMFLYLMMISDDYKSYIKSLSDGANINNLKYKELAQYKIPLPPLPEQHRIVMKLDAAFEKTDALKAKAEKNIENAKALFQQTLAEELEPKDGWVEKKIKDIGEVVGGTTPNTSNKEFWNGDRCWISPAELHGEHYLYDSARKITELAVKSKNLKELPVGTVILSSRAPIGKVAINKVPMYCNQGFKCVVCGDSIYNEFLYWWFYGKTEYLNTLGTGATFLEISKTIVENIGISIPSLIEQQQIVTKLDNLSAKCKKLEEAERKTIAECDALKQAILRQAFNGEL